MNPIYSIKFPKKVVAGAGSVARLTEMIPDAEGGVLILTDRGVAATPFMREVRALLDGASPGCRVFSDLPSEPSEKDVRALYERVAPLRTKMIVAVGGGSVMDLAKLMGAAIANPSLIEDLTDSSRIAARTAFTVAIPTTSGSGSEATANAIVLFPEKALKIGILSDTFIPDAVILDPNATVGLPPHLTASTGVDALCHSVESYISRLASPLSEVFSRRSFELIVQNIEAAYRDGTNLEARSAMQTASFFGGLCLTSSSTVAVHALSYPLGGAFHIPHGLSNAILLPAVLEANLDVIGDKLRTLAPAILPDAASMDPEEVPGAVVKSIRALLGRLGIPVSLRDYKIGPEHLDYLTEQAMAVTRLLSQNPKELGREEIRAIYETLV